MRGMRRNASAMQSAWARAMHEDADRILAFQHAYDAASKRLYPNEPLIDVDAVARKDRRDQRVSIQLIVCCFSPVPSVRPVMC